ncbi:beta-xylosidase [Grosmannia clavigera kw1407]|uniref:Beta-xylosidase n=1 Tax=Grosmannia clavigera (strain kw1407 / UAMH 11150) TaxID=655863 RepID=F0XPI6_GROCL|nr:beta-xylosidase [Grosmannia clavigera kw1407]EFX00212.1 beta-xylosidase [Grosmannia clavigera kw1407]
MPLVRNPILPGFHADPSVVRVGADYYIATSTFEWFPGVQIHHSTDLANWTLVARPLQRASQLDLRGRPDSGGVWAPDLSHDGTSFWLVFSDMRRRAGSFKDVHNYVVRAPTIAGPWTDPVHVGSSGFDPSVFHDPVDGRTWLANMLWDHRRRHHGTAFGGIALQQLELDPDGNHCRLVGPRRTIFRGSPLRLTEAPHLYRRGEFYYLLTAEGGTGYHHAVTVARARDLAGPYELHPLRHLLTSKDHPRAALQRAGHGDLVDTPDGSRSFLVHLAARPTTQERRCVLGRETAIQSVRWADDGWPYVDSGPVPSLLVDLPGHRDDNPATSPYWAERRYTFGDETEATTNGPAARLLHPDFQWLRTPEPERIFAVQQDRLTLFGRESVGSWFEQALVACRQEHFSFDAETAVEVAPTDERQFAGLIVYYNSYSFFYLAVTADGDDTSDGQRELQILTSEASWPTGDLRLPLAAPVLLPPESPARSDLPSLCAAASCSFEVGPVYDASLLSDECGGANEHGSFTGAFVGMAASDINGTAMPAHFDYFVYRPAHDRTDRYDDDQAQ